MADRLKKFVSEIRPNALWDIIKWILLLGVAGMSYALARLIPVLSGLQQGFIANLIIFLIGLVLVFVAWMLQRRKNQKKLQAVRDELKESNEALEAHKTKIEQLDLELRTMTVARDFLETQLTHLKARYEWLHEMANNHATDIDDTSKSKKSISATTTWRAVYRVSCSAWRLLTRRFLTSLSKIK